MIEVNSVDSWYIDEAKTNYLLNENIAPIIREWRSKNEQ
jgi:hypothetical protein